MSHVWYAGMSVSISPKTANQENLKSSDRVGCANSGASSHSTMLQKGMWKHDEDPSVSRHGATLMHANAIAVSMFARSVVCRRTQEYWSSIRPVFDRVIELADAMVALAQDLPGLIGARLTGGGSGGCTVNLVEQSEARKFAESLGTRYAAKTGIEPQIHICHASGGAHRLE